ncbi:fungal specific transcription factor domain-containing protein [Moesziomyces aphidis]|uniref:Fungal specific transcription factor domain-containing protein n=1 Tax=Moesziomyces aphidis TaxID=84754 RepID=W3VI26_MOEAP|nr:fungal specific transcription factor domain-containing protein [Moesziomyces aphidis]
MDSDPSPPSYRHPHCSRTTSEAQPQVPDAERAQLLSCRECQKRKTKCDKQIPCSSCTLRGIICQPVAVDPTRPRKKRFAEAELLARLRRYEALLSSAGIDFSHAEVDSKLSASSSSPTPDASVADRKRQRRSGSHISLSSQAGVHGVAQPVDQDVGATPSGSTIDPDIGHIESILETVTPFQSGSHRSTPRFQTAGGALMTTDAPLDKSDLDLISETSLHQDPAPAHAISSTLVIHKFVDLMFPDDGARNLTFDDHCPGEALIHPDASLMFRLLHIYEQNIHPLVKILHIPTVRESLCDIAAHSVDVAAHNHALFFAIYSLVIGTLPVHESKRLLNTSDPRSVAENYRRNAQTALCRASIWRSSHLTTLQAYMIYLLATRMDVDPRTYAIYSGNALRMAERLLLVYGRRNAVTGSAIGNSDLEREMVRRVWWEALLADMRASEKSGITSNPTLATASTRLPMNASDVDLSQLAESMCSNARQPSNAAWTRLRSPETESLFLLMRCEFAQFQLHPPWSHQYKDQQLQHHPFRRTGAYRQQVDPHKRSSVSDLSWRLSAVDHFERYIFARYFDRPEIATSMILQYAQHHARMNIARLRLIVHLNDRRIENEGEIIRACIIQVEETAKLIAERKFVRYQWCTFSYLPFFSFVVLLDILRRHTEGPLVDRAWDAIEDSAVIWKPDLHNKDSKDQGAQVPTHNATPDNGKGTQDHSTINLYADPSNVKDGKAKLRVRGIMLASLMVAAWEKRAQALMSRAARQANGGAPFIPTEPQVVSAMRSAAALKQDVPKSTANPAFQVGSRPDHAPPWQLGSAEGSLGNKEAEGFANRNDRAAGEAHGGSFTAFREQPPGSFASTLDDMNNLNALLQSSVDLDWSTWFRQDWDTPSSGALIDGISPVSFMPSS